MTMYILNNIQRVFQNMNKFLRIWKKYDTQWGLWDPKRKQELEKIAEKKPNVLYFDVYICVCKGLAEGPGSYSHEKDIGFVCIDSMAVIAGIRSMAMEWMASYGDILRKLAKNELTKLETEIDQFQDQLAENPETLNERKSLLGIISQILAVSMDTEIPMADVHERYRTLELYGCEADKKELADAKNLPSAGRS